jgi:ABC-2 type transport system ATP-binding protein
MTNAIQCHGVSKRFDQVTALDGLELAVEEGTVYGYLGPNGAGKTTTIRLLIGLVRPTAGQILVLGVDPCATEVRSRIGYLPGELRLDQRVTIAEQLDHWARLHHGVDPAFLRRLLLRLDLDPSRACRSLSSGNRRKVGLVGAFMTRPELLILDEPTSGLDPLMQQEYLRLVAEARQAGSTVFMSSHSLAEVQQAADRIAVLRAGRIVLEGGVEDLRRRVRQTYSVRFAGVPPVSQLRALDDVAGLQVDGNRVTFQLTAEPGPVLRVLAASSVRELLAPEPDVEDVFLSLYSGAAAPSDDAS